MDLRWPRVFWRSNGGLVNFCFGTEIAVSQVKFSVNIHCVLFDCIHRTYWMPRKCTLTLLPTASQTMTSPAFPSPSLLPCPQTVSSLGRDPAMSPHHRWQPWMMRRRVERQKVWQGLLDWMAAFWAAHWKSQLTEVLASVGRCCHFNIFFHWLRTYLAWS